MKIAFITTSFNEEGNVKSLLDSLRRQSRKPDEIIIVDGGSTDKTVKSIKEWIKNVRSKNLRKRIKLIVKKGNRSIGRNEAVRKAKSGIIISSDFGCILDRNFIRNIVNPLNYGTADVVAGFSKGQTNSIFQKALIPYVLVMSDKVNVKNFLPAARSMAFTKDIWKRVGGFPVEYSFNEDYVFAKRLKKINSKIAFKRNAFVFYIPRSNLVESFVMFFRFAFGDAQSGILRPKVFFIFLRYIAVLWLLIYSYIFKLPFITKFILYILLLYIAWSIWKNYRYVNSRKAFLYLPLLQFTSDFAVIFGSVLGFSKAIWDTQAKR